MAMEYITATEEQVDDIHRVLQTTIRSIYPKYYPAEVTGFFCDLHSLDHVREGVASGNMGVLVEDGEIIGKGCFDGNHITGVYVLPACQGKGCGSMIIDHLENIIGKDHEMAVLDASLPAALLYEHRGYRTVGHGIIDLENDAKLVFEKMEKPLRRVTI